MRPARQRNAIPLPGQTRAVLEFAGHHDFLARLPHWGLLDRGVVFAHTLRQRTRGPMAISGSTTIIIWPVWLGLSGSE